MTHVVHPFAHRLGIIRDWRSHWFSKTPAQFRENTMVDVSIRKFLKKRLRGSYVTSIEIERDEKYVRVRVKTSRPGMIIGRGGDGTTKLVKEIEQVVKKVPGIGQRSIRLDIEEVRSPESQAAIVAYMIAEGIEKQQTFRRVMKQMAEKTMANRDVLGVRIALAGRLGGAEMSRAEELKRGRVPLQTLRADIDFAREEAYMSYGVIGIKVWIYRGDIFVNKENK